MKLAPVFDSGLTFYPILPTATIPANQGPAGAFQFHFQAVFSSFIGGSVAWSVTHTLRDAGGVAQLTYSHSGTAHTVGASITLSNDTFSSSFSPALSTVPGPNSLGTALAPGYEAYTNAPSMLAQPGQLDVFSPVFLIVAQPGWYVTLDSCTVTTSPTYTIQLASGVRTIFRPRPGFDVTVSDAVANFTPNSSDAVSFDYNLNIAASDPDASIVSRVWNFGDGGTGTGSTPTHPYPDSGSFVATETATDNYGGQGTATVTIPIVVALPSLVYDAHAGGLFFFYVNSTGTGSSGGTMSTTAAARLARNFDLTSWDTSNSLLIESGPVSLITGFRQDHLLGYVYSTASGMFLRTSKDEGANWSSAMLLASGLSQIGLDIDAHGTLIIVGKDGSGNAKQVLAHNVGETDQSATPAAAVSGLPTNLSGGALKIADEKVLLVAKSGTALNLYTSVDEGATFS